MKLSDFKWIVASGIIANCSFGTHIDYLSTYPSITCYHMSNLKVGAPTWSTFGWLVNTQSTLHILLQKTGLAVLCDCALCLYLYLALVPLYMAYLFITSPSSRLMANSINLSDCHLRIGNWHCDTLFSLVLYAWRPDVYGFPIVPIIHDVISYSISTCHAIDWTHRSYSILSV